MSGTEETDVARPQPSPPIDEDEDSASAAGVERVSFGSVYKERDEEVEGERGSSSPSAILSKISSRPTTPSCGRRRTCVVHLDGCSYTIVASPPDLLQTTSNDTTTDMMTTPMTSDSYTKDTALSRTDSQTPLRTTKSSDGSRSDGGTGRAAAAAAQVTTVWPGVRTTSTESSSAAIATGRSLRQVSTTRTLTASRSSDEKEEETETETEKRNSCEVDDTRERLSLIDSTLVPHLCSFRLRHLLVKLSAEDVEKDVVIKNLEDVIRCLDSTFAEEIRSSIDDDEDDDLNEVETQAVPNEVRDWLAMTFTRSNHSATKRRVNDKPKFRSVANAIRAGILVDRLYRRVSNYVGRLVPAKIVTLLKSTDDWSFDVFALDEASEGHSLRFIGYDLLQRYDLINKLKMSTQTVDCLLGRLEQGYSKYANPYHNMVHAADVTQTMHHIISRSGLSVWLSDVDVLAAIVAALIHDYEHTGTTNTFHINTSSEMALLYNDKAVLENHHISAAFHLLKEDECNIVSNLKTDEYREFRSLVIDMVLATDMSSHFQQIKNMKTTISLRESVDKTKAMSLIVHCADISHPAKEWQLHHRWTELLMEEFFRQGDREANLGLQISPLCDRKNTLVAESQIGFIDFIVDPSLQVMGDMLDRIIEENSSTTAEDTTNIDLHPTNQMNSKLPSSHEGSKFHMTREWDACLVNNRHLWKERADIGWISPLQEEVAETGIEIGKIDTRKEKRISTTEDIFFPSSLQDDPVEMDSGTNSPGLTTDLTRPGKHDVQITTTPTKA